jgi:hypothetical protein
MKRTIVLEVPSPPSASLAPFRLRGWLAHVDRTSILRSNAESTENTPTNTPAGGKESRFTGGNGGSIVPDADKIGSLTEDK